MVINNLVFPHCWICEVRFNDQIPPGPAMKELHHIFPQNAGGTDGPVVSLCDTHHTKAHKVAYAVKAKRPFNKILVGEPDERKKKICWLASLIVKAEALTKGDVNKPLKVTLILDRVRQAKALSLKQRLGVKTLAEVFDVAFNKLYNSL